MTEAPDLDVLLSQLGRLHCLMRSRVDGIVERDGSREAAVTGIGVGIGYLLAKEIADALGQAEVALARQAQHPADERVMDLAAAAWQVLDDMGPCDSWCSDAAKVRLRCAYEPFAHLSDAELDCQVDAARSVAKEIGLDLPPSAPWMRQHPAGSLDAVIGAIPEGFLAWAPGKGFAASAQCEDGRAGGFQVHGQATARAALAAVAQAAGVEVPQAAAAPAAPSIRAQVAWMLAEAEALNTGGIAGPLDRERAHTLRSVLALIDAGPQVAESDEMPAPEKFTAGGRLQYAAPGDRQRDYWLLRFDDPDRRPMSFDGEGAEEAAWAAWNRFAPTWSCSLLQLARVDAQSPQADKDGRKPLTLWLTDEEWRSEKKRWKNRIMDCSADIQEGGYGQHVQDELSTVNAILSQIYSQMGDR